MKVSEQIEWTESVECFRTGDEPIKQAVLASLRLLEAAQAGMPEEPHHTPECCEQNTISWQCVCEFDARVFEYVKNLRAHCVALGVTNTELENSLNKHVVRITELMLEVDDAHKQIISLQGKVPPRRDEQPRNPRNG